LKSNKGKGAVPHLRFLLLLLSLVALAVSAEVTVTDLRVENMASPLGVGTISSMGWSNPLHPMEQQETLIRMQSYAL
jgi:hypothetical protein